mgnify:CR=1 FL=1
MFSQGNIVYSKNMIPSFSNITIPDIPFSLNYEIGYCIFVILFFVIFTVRCCYVYCSTKNTEDDVYFLHTKNSNNSNKNADVSNI